MTSTFSLDMPIVIVAPYSPVGSCDSPHLGAAKKLASMLSILSQFGRPIIFVNSAHNRLVYSRGRTSNGYTGQGQSLTTVVPFTISNRPIGKLLNLLSTASLAREIAARKPALVWIYNGYAFEAKFALELNAICGCPIVLEIEDWHTARSRGLNPKPVFDMYYFNKVLPRAALVACVNKAARDRLTLAESMTMLLPSVVDGRLITKADSKAPFSDRPYRLGYFGGLSAEKGADIVLALGSDLPPDWDLTVTGSGPLVHNFRMLAANKASRIRFTSDASEDELYREMLQCDAIVNPHRSIADMGDGVFPFKVFEALASGRLLISSALPDAGLALDRAVLFFDGSVAGLRDSLARAKPFYASRLSDILGVSDKVRALYSEDAVFSELNQRLSFLRVNSGNIQ